MTPRSITFEVEGEPQPEPKKRFNRTTGRPYPIDKYKDGSLDGRKYAWGQLVRVMAATKASRGLAEVMFPKPMAVRLGVEVRVRRPKRNKKEHPTQTPDWSNYRYYIENLLEGTLYEDDCQVIGPLPGDKHWCRENEEPGVTITVTEVKDVG